MNNQIRSIFTGLLFVRNLVLRKDLLNFSFNSRFDVSLISGSSYIKYSLYENTNIIK